MSEKDVRAFYEKVAVEPALQAKLKALEAQAKASIMADLTNIAKEAGFTFTPEDYAKAVAQTTPQDYAKAVAQKEVEAVKGKGGEPSFCGGGTANQAMWGCFPGTWV